MTSYYEDTIKSTSCKLILPDKTTLNVLVWDGSAACSGSDLEKLKSFPEESFVTIETGGTSRSLRLKEVYKILNIGEYQ